MSNRSMSNHDTDQTGFYTESPSEREEREAVMAGTLEYSESATDATAALDAEREAFWDAQAENDAEQAYYDLLRGCY